jgi:uncharacterized protein (TIRG00374 family)
VLKGPLSSRRFWLQLALTAGFLGLLAWRIDIGDAFATFPDVNWAWVFPGLLLFSISKALHAARWRVFLGDHRDVPLSGLVGIFFIHNMANAILLLRAGDVLRIQTTSQRYKIPRSELTATVIVVETLLDGLTFVLLIVLAASLGAVPSSLQVPFWTMAGLAMFGLALGFVGANLVRPAWLMSVYPFRWFSHSVRESAAVMLESFLDGMRALREVRLAAPAIVLSIAGWSAEALSYMLFGEAFGLDLSFADYMLIMLVANFAVAVPITPSGIGPYEVATSALIVELGATSALAGGFAIGIHISFIVWITVVGLVSMWLMKLNPSEIFYFTRTLETEVQAEAS